MLDIPLHLLFFQAASMSIGTLIEIFASGTAVRAQDVELYAEEVASGTDNRADA